MLLGVPNYIARTLERTLRSILGTSTRTSACRCFAGALALCAVMPASLLSAPINADTLPFTADTLPFTYSTEALGISLAQFKRQYPECDAVEDRSEQATMQDPLAGYKFPPLTGYDPPFPDLLPNYRGSYLTKFGPWGDPHMAFLGDGYFAVYYIRSRINPSLIPPSYTRVRLRLLRNTPLNKDPRLA